MVEPTVITDQTVRLALIAAAVQTIAIFAGIAISYINSRKLNTIHTLTNGNVTKVIKDLELAKGEIDELQKLIGTLVAEKGAKILEGKIVDAKIVLNKE